MKKKISTIDGEGNDFNFEMLDFTCVDVDVPRSTYYEVCILQLIHLVTSTAETNI